MLDEQVYLHEHRITPGLPGRDYFDPAVFELEKDTCFFRSWFCIGRADELPAPGDFLTRDVADQSILVSRTKTGDVRAFYNVCRHRGSVLSEIERGHANNAYVCPYHNWTYALDGELIGTPNVRAEDGLDRSAHGLSPVHCEVWDGFVFVNLTDGTPTRSLVEQLAIEPDGPLDYERYRAGELVTGARIVYEVEANWKIVHDNFNECLHCPSVHPELVQIVPLYRKGMVVDLDREDLGATLEDGLTTFTLTGKSTKLPVLPGLSDLDQRTYYGYSVFPNLLMNMVSTGLMAYTLYPRSATHTRVVSEYLFRPETVAADGFDPSDMVEFLDLVSRQDWTVCERAQRGVRSRGFVGGVYPPQDGLLHRFAERYQAERG
jgi:Rieske 2Fe-2S family protein